MLRRLLVSVVTLFLTAAPALALQPPSPPDGFVPIDTLPPSEQLPAAPFLIGAYVFFLLLMMFYLWTIWQRLGKVEQEMKALERRSQGGHVR
jgi:type VI protein secretion system component VasF